VLMSSTGNRPHKRHDAGNRVELAHHLGRPPRRSAFASPGAPMNVKLMPWFEAREPGCARHREVGD
jgi:hypothetical protein